jgi:hypothetical protein
MPDYTPSPEQEQHWVKLLKVAAKPAFWPSFPELNCAGEWTNWTATPVLPDIDPFSVQQLLSNQKLLGNDNQHISHDTLRPSS